VCAPTLCGARKQRTGQFAWASCRREKFSLVKWEWPSMCGGQTDSGLSPEFFNRSFRAGRGAVSFGESISGSHALPEWLVFCAS